MKKLKILTFVNLIIFTSCTSIPENLCKKWYLYEISDQENTKYNVGEGKSFINLKSNGIYESMGFVEGDGKWNYNDSDSNIVFDDTLKADIVLITSDSFSFQITVRDRRMTSHYLSYPPNSK